MIRRTQKVSIFWDEKEYVRTHGNRGGIEIDCSIKETHSRESPASQFPLEDGSVISDNIILNPETLEIEGFVSDSPLDLAASITTAAVSALGTKMGPLGSAALVAGYSQSISTLFELITGEESDSPPQKAFKTLKILQLSKIPLIVVTTLHRYADMYIKNISVPRDVNSGQGLSFTIQFVQLELVSPLTISIKVFKDANTAAPKADKGQQQATPESVEKFSHGEDHGQDWYDKYVKGGG